MKTEITLANMEDVVLANRDIIRPEGVLPIIVKDAVVDTKATLLYLPKPIIEQLNLTPVSPGKAITAAGISDCTIYSDVWFMILERRGSLPVGDLPADNPVLIGQVVLEQVGLYLDRRAGLIHNPYDDNDYPYDDNDWFKKAF